MDQLASPPNVIKRRRRHTRRFKEQVLAECQQPGQSVAAVALRHGLNHNLVHKWRRAFEREANKGEFLRLPSPSVSTATGKVAATSLDTLRIEVPGPKGNVTVHWPMSQALASADWLKALMQ